MQKKTFINKILTLALLIGMLVPLLGNPEKANAACGEGITQLEVTAVPNTSRYDFNTLFSLKGTIPACGGLVGNTGLKLNIIKIESPLEDAPEDVTLQDVHTDNNGRFGESEPVGANIPYPGTWKIEILNISDGGIVPIAPNATISLPQTSSISTDNTGVIITIEESDTTTAEGRIYACGARISQLQVDASDGEEIDKFLTCPSDQPCCPSWCAATTVTSENSDQSDDQASDVNNQQWVCGYDGVTFSADVEPPPPAAPCADAENIYKTNDDGSFVTDLDGNPILIGVKCKAVHTAFGIPLSTDPAEFIGNLLGIILSVSGGIAVLIIIYSGYQFIMSRGNPETLQAARERLVSAIVGLIFIIFSLVILETIGVDVLGLPGFTTNNTSATSDT